MSGIPTERFEKVEVASLAELRDWLAANHTRDEGVWLVTFMKCVPDKFVHRWDVLDELLCFGWVDGIRRKLDDARTMQLITPRRQQAWTATYRARVARLEADGRMAKPGRNAVERSKGLDLWMANTDVDALVVPDDLRAALDAHPPASANFDAAAPSYRRNVLRWVATAKRPDTRAKRIAELAALSVEGCKVPQM